jgi:FlaA1/EpsC-like NDP-sugar epimerase
VKINHSERLLAWVIVSFKTAFVAGLPIVVDYGVFLLLGIGIRSLRRYLFEASLGISSSKRTLLMGTTEGLASALRQISFHSEIHVVCLLSPDKKLRGARLAGFTVFDGPEELPTYLAAESDRDVGTSSGAGHKNPLCQHASGRETARRIVERFRRGESDKLPKRVADRALTATG